MKFFAKSPVPEPKTKLSAQQQSQRRMDSRLFVNLHDLIALRTHANGFVLNPASQIKNQFIGRHGSKHRGRGLNFEELAHYQHGDDIRTMDWKVTNRTGKPHVRVFTEERERPIMLVCDQRKNMLFGSQNKLKSVLATEVFSLLAWRQLALSDAIATLIFNDEEISEARPHRSRQMLLNELSTLARFNQALQFQKKTIAEKHDKEVKLSNVLDRLNRLCPRNYLIVLISDFSDFDKRANQQIKSLALYNDVFAAHICDPVERRLPEGKQFVASNGAQQLSIDSSDTTFTHAFNNHQQQEFAQLKVKLNSAGVMLMNFDTICDSQQQLRRCIPENTALNRNRRQLDRADNG